jgi:hypothetical protein
VADKPSEQGDLSRSFHVFDYIVTRTILDEFSDLEQNKSSLFATMVLLMFWFIVCNNDFTK